jgi:hypothetical protein
MLVRKLSVAFALVMLLGLAASSAHAQMGVGVGVKGGLNLANVSVDPDDEDCCDMKVGGVVGGFVNVPFSEMASFQPEVLFTQKGAKFGEGTDEGKLKVNAVEIPLLFRADLSSGDGARPFVVVGPAFSFKTSAKFEDNAGNEVDADEDIESTDVGLIFGGGVAAGPATFEARYDLGLRDLDKSAGQKVKSRTLSFLIGFRFGS